MTDGPLDHRTMGRLWDATAPAWTRLARAGYHVYRDHLNTPALLAMLPNVDGLAGLDIGCGEGHNTRLLAGRGAAMTAIDISPRFIRAARELEDAEPLGIRYQVASAVALPFPDDSFDFTTAFMSLQDVPETEAALAEAARVLKRGGFLQFSICHPCSDTPHRRSLKDQKGKTYAVDRPLLRGRRSRDRGVAVQRSPAGGEGGGASLPASPRSPDPQPLAERDRRGRAPPGADRGTLDRR